MSLVLDASMSITWLFEDEHTESALAILRRVAEEGAVVPSLWRLEVANALRAAVRRRRCDEPFVDRSLPRLDRLPIEIDAETDAHAWGMTRAVSRADDLTLYDAAYLELALRRNLPLASNDTDLIDAARRRGLEVLGT